ncbi:ABC transporter ATP-binding protein [Natronobeatus ordinarius]|uniref:ABC transporter ATP-binding protein n=1 Tax=Natronobeatus ordinarius TaxID=2963433 RepID=UPI0020CF2BFA|nr:ABC transporter ATP-binding protein [Natronobeatus ordinarius]
MALLEARNVETGYGDAKIIHGVDVDVHADELVTLIGPNGAGKSTLMKALFGLIECWDGTVEFRGENITNVEPHLVTRKGICYVPQLENIFPSLTVRENLNMGAYILDEVPEAALRDVYDRFPILEERANQVAGTLSGGQRQMLAMGRGLMVDPDVLFIDEPSAGLAPDLVDEVFEKIVEIRDDGTAVLFVEQNARKALQISERGYVLEMGRNRFEGSGDELLQNEEVEQLYLGG